jgi:small subunit ribosomal protein S16
MLTIRMQRTGRKGHAMFRVVVQDSRQAPTSGKLVAHLGNYDPHSKTLNLDKEKAAFYLEHGAQPSERAARLLKGDGVKLPKWVKEPAKKERAVRNPDKRRSTAPEKPAEEAAAETPTDEAAAAEAPAEAPAETPAEEQAETPETPAETPAQEPAADAATADGDDTADTAAETGETEDTQADESVADEASDDAKPSS